jgi:putative ABC transport system ATP-binding protein
VTVHTARQIAVECRQVTHQYGQGESSVFALRGLDLDVYAGQLTLLVGPSGCGKTTLLSVIAGILRPTAGQVRVLGLDLAALTGEDRVSFRRDQVGFVFQQFNLLPELTALENVAVPLIIGGTPRREALRRSQEMLERVRIGHRAKAYPPKMSGGEQQRVAIARALVHRPHLLVCDEPTSALDGKTGHAIMELLNEFAVDPERAVIVVTHDARVFEFGDRIAYLNDGMVVKTETKAA